jgi:hypothetical protein
MKRLHYFSGITISIFVALHISNHLMILKSETAHLEFMDVARKFYRHPIFETILFAAIVIQVISGIQLVRRKWNNMPTLFDKLQVFSGLYLVYFLVGHTLAVLVGRYNLKLDTNLYYGASVLNNYPAVFYYVLHYGLAIIAIFTHVACVHHKKMVSIAGSKQSLYQSWFVITTGVLLAIVIVYHMIGIVIPKTYQYLPFGSY